MKRRPARWGRYHDQAHGVSSKLAAIKPISRNIEESRPVSYVVDQLCRGWGSGASFRIEKSEGLHEASLLQLDSSHAQTALGWRPLLELPEALAWTANWYKSFYNGESMRARSLESLDRMERMEKGIP